jgi:hypothetical protein
MNGHSYEGACFDLGHCTSGEGILSVLSNINVASQLRSTTLVDNVRTDFGISDDGCVLLTGTDTCSVSRDDGINWRIVINYSSPTFAGNFIPWKPTLGGEPASPWAAIITP